MGPGPSFMAVPSREVGARYCAPVLTNQEVFWPGGVSAQFHCVHCECSQQMASPQPTTSHLHTSPFISASSIAQISQSLHPRVCLTRIPPSSLHSPPFNPSSSPSACTNSLPSKSVNTLPKTALSKCTEWSLSTPKRSESCPVSHVVVCNSIPSTLTARRSHLLVHAISSPSSHLSESKSLLVQKP